MIASVYYGFGQSLVSADHSEVVFGVFGHGAKQGRATNATFIEP